ncbi:MAG TPA: cobalt transporter CbiM [Oscillatoriaceae cyanobacterium M33_DOE_052]|uniref:Cobalt transporter CbiM n=1 Tax=Planktothricoides sp. SpSt-374 TaxID=2282167 RepID=A0A7C3ZYP3_9CYAN|nr:cobalt transporter CbiM [Oscillatoriaceae cyanobacterium M33_DOE_052]
MHISEGLLPAKVCIGGYAIASVITWYSLRRIEQQPNPTAGIPKAALLTAAFFVASSIRIPIPPASLHLVLNGMLGAILADYAFPAILVGLLFQAVMFGHGGLTTLGVNATMMGVPAILAARLFQMRHFAAKYIGVRPSNSVFAFVAGAGGLGITALIFFGITVMGITADIDAGAEQKAISALMISHLPLMVIEGIFTTLLVNFLARVKPEIL